MDTANDRRAKGTRLRAARLASGRYEIAGAVGDMAGVADATYRAVEKGSRTLGPALAAKAAGCFGVSIGFLLHANPGADDDAAVSMFGLLDRLQTAGVRKPDPGFRLRLQRRRRGAGFKSAAAAARAFGWVRSRYSDHENGRRKIPLDQAIRYALELADDPYDLIVGPVLHEAIPAQTSASVSVGVSPVAVPDDGATGWRWLQSFGRAVSPLSIRAPVVALLRTGPELLSDPMAVPAILVPGARDDGTLYWIMDLRGDRVRTAYLVEAALIPGEKVIETGSGLRVSSGVPDGAVLIDPLERPVARNLPLILGTLRHVLAVS